MRWTFAIGWMKRPREVLRQRKAMLALQSTGRDAGGSRVSTRSSSASPRLTSFSSSDIRYPALGTVLGVDGNVFVRQVAGPDGGRGSPALEHHADRNLALPHHPLSVLLAVPGGARALPCDLHLVE